MKEYRVNKLALAQVIGAAKKYTDAKAQRSERQQLKPFSFEFIGIRMIAQEPELDASIIIMEQLLRRIEADDDGK